MPVRSITRWYLEMTGPEQLAPGPPPQPGFEVRHAAEPSPEFARFLYTAVGGDWFWVDRLHWDWSRWRAHVERPAIETWVGWLHGTPAGYGELARQGDAVLLAYFGLLPGFMGRGLGPLLLHAVVSRAWETGPRRVHLSTCSLDAPAALRTYERAGFRVFQERIERVPLPDVSPGPWPGAGRPTAVRA